MKSDLTDQGIDSTNTLPKYEVRSTLSASWARAAPSGADIHPGAKLLSRWGYLPVPSLASCPLIIARSVSGSPDISGQEICWLYEGHSSHEGMAFRVPCMGSLAFARTRLDVPWKSTGYQLPLDFVGAHPHPKPLALRPGCFWSYLGTAVRKPGSPVARSNVAQRRACFCFNRQSVNPPGKSFHHEFMTTRQTTRHGGLISHSSYCMLRP